MELKENKNNKKNYIFWIMWILGIYFFTMIVLSIEIDDKTIYAWKEWFNTFKITGLVVIDILFSITMVILSIIFCVIAKKKINAWDGYDKDAQLNLDKYLNGASLVIVFLIYVGAIFTAIICDGGIEQDDSLYESIIYFLVSVNAVFSGSYGLCLNFFVLKRLGAQYDEKRELGWKNHLDSEKIICAKSEIENEIEKVKAKTYKFSNYVLMIVFCVCFIFSLSFKGFTQITIVIGIMWLVIYCYYIIGVSKV